MQIPNINKEDNPIQCPNHYHNNTLLMDALIANRVPWAEGNVCKYVVRWEHKDGLNDLYKARDYLNAVIANAELKQVGNTGSSMQSSLFPAKPEIN
mgnify:CR=1 FL=1